MIPASASAQDHAFSYLERPAFHSAFSSSHQFDQNNSPRIDAKPCWSQ